MENKELKETDLMSAVVFVSPSIRYFKTSGEFEIKVMDVYEYLMSGESVPVVVKISEEDLLRMIRVDEALDEEEKNEFYYHQLFALKEQVDLDDDTFRGISLVQYFYHLSERTLVLAKRMQHLRKLNKTETAWVELKKRMIHSKGGRPKGSKNKVSIEEAERLEDLKKNFEVICAKCVERDWWKEYEELYKDLKLPDAKKKYAVERYLWKLKNGYCQKDTKFEEKMKKYLP